MAAMALTAAGCEDEEKATPQVIFDGRLTNGSDNDCRDAREIFRIGDFGNPGATPKVPPKAVKNGEKGDVDPYDQGNVSVSCSVVPAGANEFDVSASLDLGGATGGFFRIDGRFKTTGEQANIRAQFSSRASANTYDQRDRGCIVRYTTSSHGVAAGRVWGEITCPKAENITTNDGRACEAGAQFRFENCAQ
jgi:hypothetical protein